MDSAIEVRGLVKRYGELTAVNGVDFEVATGETFGFHHRRRTFTSD